MTYTDIFYQNIDQELYEYYKALDILSNPLTEGILDKLTTGIKSKIDFITEIAKIIGKNIKDIVVLFKNSKFFKIFKALHFSVKYIIDMYKKGLKLYNSLENIIAKKINDLGGVKYIRKNLKVLDDWFNSHPMIKKLGGLAVGSLLLYIWINMSFTPNFGDSFDFTDIINSFLGKFHLSDLFATESGITMLIYFATGALTGVSFPWPGNLTRKIITALVYTTYKQIKPNIKLVF